MTHILFWGDSHGGHTHGLLNPEVCLQGEDETGQLYDYQPELRGVQKWLWYDVLLPGLERVKQIAGNDLVHIAHTGDLAHGVKRPEELVTTRLSDQIEIAVANWKPFLSLPNVGEINLIIGTGSHEFQEGSATYLVSRRLEKEFGKPAPAMFHLLAEVDGKRIDISHHGPTPGSRTWLWGNMARFYLRDQIMDEGEQAADLYVRAHYHAPVWERLADANWSRDYHLMITPPMCTPGAWTRQATRSVKRATAGLVLVEVGKQLTPHLLCESVDIRTKKVWTAPTTKSKPGQN